MMNKKIKVLGRLGCFVISMSMMIGLGINAYATEEYAYSIGTDYGLFDVDTSADAETASTAFALAGYKSYYNTAPTVEYMQGNNPAGTRRIGSAVVLYSGHGNNQCVSFNYKGKGGEYLTGVIYGTDWVSANTGYEYVGIKDTDMSNNKLSVFAACNTANGTDTITKRAYEEGSDAAIGWTVKVDASSHSQWLARFTNELANGKSVSEAAQYANGYTYSDTNVKSYKIYGDTTLVIKRSLADVDSLERAIELNESIEVNISEKEIEDLNSYMIDNVGLNFNNVCTEITNLSNGNGVVDYKIMISGCETTSGYVAIINNNVVTAIYKNNVDIPIPMSINLEEIDIDRAFQEAKENIDAYDIILEQEGKRMYDAISGEMYYLVFTTYIEGDNCMGVDSYKYYGGNS